MSSNYRLGNHHIIL